MAGPVYIEGLDQVLRNLQAKGDKVVQAASAGLQKGASSIIAYAQDNLRKNGSVVTGLLRLSGKTQKVDDLNIDAGFFDTRNQQSGYAYFVEYGRRAGRMPPPDELAQWAYKKFGIGDRKAARAIGWAMAVKIAKAGTKPHPFFAPAIDKNKSSLVQAIQDAINRETR